jgi:TolB-like protein/DNA-binding winged helix-turn-helix (wHTH) protein/Flp pilus assembly protein TadD
LDAVLDLRNFRRAMNQSEQRAKTVRFGVFQLDLASGELYKHGIRLKLQDQPIQVLTVLLERPGQVVSREELRQRLWGDDTFVDFDHSLNISINKLRDALGDSASTPRFIETLPRKGYRFIAPAVVEVEAQALIKQEHSTEASAGSPPGGPKKRPMALITSLAAAILVSGLIVWMRTWPSATPPGSGKMLLAVLPFENLTGDQNEDFFVAGLHEEMITQLGRVHPSRLGVIARNSVTQYAGQHTPVTQIAHDLHVSYVVDGAVRSAGDRFRISAQLIQTSDQTQLWAETYDVGMKDILKLQEDVARRVADSLALEFLPEAQRELVATHTQNVEAYEAYLRGRYLWSFETRSAIDQAIAEFQKAIRLDPNYAPAYAGLADAYLVLGGYGFVPPEQAFPAGKEAAAKALELAPNLSDAYSSLGFSAFYYDWNWPEAERMLRKAIELEPNNQLAHEFYGSFLHIMGRLDEAEVQCRIAMELGPMSAWIHDDKGWLLLTRGRPQEAAEEFRKAIEFNSRFPAAHLSLAVAYSRLKEFDRALAEVHTAEELGGDPTRVMEVLGSTQALSGDVAAAKATVQRLISGKFQGRVSPYSVALIYTALGRKPDALDWLEKGYREKESWLPWIGVLREWDSLRSEPRFAELLRKLKLQEHGAGR